MKRRYRICPHCKREIEIEFIKEFGDDFWIEKARADERANTVQFIIDEFNRRTACLGRAPAKKYVIDTLNEILNEIKEYK